MSADAVAEVRLGTMLFTLVEPEPGHEVGYNRWYERDHFYAGCLDGPHCFAGDRFVATRRLKQLRYPDVSDLLANPRDGSYLALYWIMAGHHDEWNRWAVDRVNQLHAQGRMFPHRRHVHTLLYDHRWSASAHGGCPVELALDHDYAGLVVVAGRVAQGRTQDEVDRWFRHGLGPADLVAGFTPLPLLDDAPGDVVRADVSADRFLQLHFLEHDPEDAWGETYAGLGEAFAATGLGEVTLVAPFIQTEVGTDRYTDEL